MKHTLPCRSLPKHWRLHRSSLSKKESIKISCESLQTRWNKTKIPHKSTKEPFGFYSNHHSECNRCELVTLEIYFLESL